MVFYSRVFLNTRLDVAQILKHRVVSNIGMFVNKLTVFTFHKKIDFQYQSRNEMDCKESDNLKFKKKIDKVFF